MITVIQKPTPNYARHNVPRDVKAVVIHVAEGTEEGTDSHFASDPTDVSAHFLVGLDGELRQYVSVHDVAWHAGRIDRPTWKGLRPGNPNSYTIGIEHEGMGKTPWPEEQLSTSALLSAWLCERFKIVPSGLTFPLHREIFAGKSCPGPAFDRSAYLARVRWNLETLGPDLKRFFVGLR